MAEITLVTGGCRSGKSTFAEKKMLELSGPHLYIATSPNIDNELDERITKHQNRRASYGWDTIEEQVDLTRMVYRNNGGSTLVECLTLWINNLLYVAEQKGEELSEESVKAITDELLTLCKDIEGHIIFVTNETGWGIMPENALARKFADLCGRCNQTIAAAADHVYLIVSGIPQKIK